MKRVGVKCCGLRSVADAERCLKAGADFLGVIRVPETPRYQTFETLSAIVNLAPEKVVAVYQNAPLEKVLEDIDQAGLQNVQLHGHESPDYLRRLKSNAQRPLNVWKVFSIFEAFDAETLKAYSPYLDVVLLDAPKSYKGAIPWETMDFSAWQVAASEAKIPLFLAGKLNAETVGAIVKRHQPDGVDVASGIENRETGLKDAALIRAFIKSARPFV